MSEEVERWVVKAEGDYFSAMREYRARKHPNYDSACFHAQQAVSIMKKLTPSLREFLNFKS
jgi:HEPN domain-containing protein